MELTVDERLSKASGKNDWRVPAIMSILYVFTFVFDHLIL
jgi:hypothetical protein